MPVVSRRRVLMGLAGAPLLAACAGSGAAESMTPAEQTVSITYMHQWGAGPGHGATTDALVARFKEQHPKTQVEAVFTAEYYVKLAAILASGDLPDVITYNLSFVPVLVKQGIVVSADSLAKGAHRINSADLVPAAREMATFEGKIAVTPYVLNSTGLALNASLYRQKGLDPTKPPTTWEALVDHARRLTGSDGTREVWGTVFPKGTSDPIAPLVAFIWQNGGDLVDVQKKTALWTSPQAIEALQWQVDLVHRHRVAAYPTPGNGEQGAVGIWHIPPAHVNTMATRLKDVFEGTTAELPKGKQQATVVGGHSLAVLKTNKHHDRAWQFVHWYVQPAQNAEYLVASTTLPPWRASERHAVWQKFTADEPRFEPFTRMLSYARPTPKLTRWQEIITVLQQARDAAAELKRTPKEALEDAALQAAPLIQEG